MCTRNALDSVAIQHKVELEQARHQAVAEYCARALSETADMSDTSVLTDLQASNAVSSLVCLCLHYTVYADCLCHSPPLLAS